MTELELLRIEIKDLSEKYYGEGESTCPDNIFDQKLNRLRELSPNDELLKTGHGYSTKGIDDKEKFQHPLDVGSIEKTKSIQDVKKFSNETTTQSTKIDGNSVVYYYKNGKLFEIVTRGSDNIGIIRTGKFIDIATKQLPIKGYISVRGEAAIKKSNYTTENGFDITKSSRNAVAGAISRKDDYKEVFKYVDFIAYTFKDCDTGEDLSNKIDWSEYFKVEPQKPIDPLFYTDIQAYKKKYKDDYEYEADGMVFKNGDEYIAFKFDDETAQTNLLSVQWNIGKDQRLTPVAILKPVELAGATIERASLGSYSRACEVGCWPVGFDHVVEIIRANEIIPYVTKTVSKSLETEYGDFPTCPICNHKSVQDGEHVFCVNPECGNINSSRLYNFAEQFYEEGLSDKIVEKFFEAEEIHDVFDLLIYNKEFNKSVYGLGESHIAKINKFLKNISGALDVRTLYKTFILNCGDRASEKIVDSGFDLIAFLKDESEIKKLKSISNFSSNIIFELIAKKGLFEQVLTLRDIIQKKNEIVKVGSFCITGVRFSKDQLKRIQDLGWVEDSSVKKTTTYLIVKDVESNSSKTQKAKELGIKIITIPEFMNLINN